MVDQLKPSETPLQPWLPATTSKLQVTLYVDKLINEKVTTTVIPIDGREVSEVRELLSVVHRQLGSYPPSGRVPLKPWAVGALNDILVGKPRIDEEGGAVLEVAIEKPGRFAAVSRSAERVLVQLGPLLAMVALFAWGVFYSGQGRDLARSGQEGIWFWMGLAFSAAVVLAVFGACAHALLGFFEGTADRVSGKIVSSFQLVFPILMYLVGYLIWSPSPSPATPLFVLSLFGCLWLMRLLFYGAYFLVKFKWVAGLVGAGVILAIGFFPSEVGEKLGSAVVIGLAISAWMLVLTEITRWRRAKHISVVHLLMILVIGGLALRFLAWATLPLGNNLDWIRGTASHASSPTMDDAYASAMAFQPRDGATLVIIAAAGGGIRASYWTSLVLTHATDNAPTMRNKLFLASGVSGGSVGLALYRALIGLPAPPCRGESGKFSYQSCVTEFHKHDFLAGIIGATLTGQLLNLVVPVFPLRSEVLERTWEQRWADILPSAPNLFSASFRSLWRGQPDTWEPALALNTTSVGGGYRIAISSLDVHWIEPHSQCRPNIAEQLDLPLSAAANASARFPYLEEWGWFRLVKRDAANSACSDVIGVADGGFYDNYGAATALDAYKYLKSISNTGDKAPRIIVIQITSDPDCGSMALLDGNDGRLAECSNAKKRQQEELSLKATGYDAIQSLALFGSSRVGAPGPFGVAMQARSMSGIRIALELRNEVIGRGDKYYHFSLAGVLESPLGWTLSSHARRQITALLEGGYNRTSMDELVKELNRGSSMEVRPP
ncbi:hypothetical protein CQ12_11480 [Bradyrhizobium jicamae]|uniref:PNPLA domain-containing protein n=1 Tax=Bradyrhizobium jicamae TaxID=280332 RepID=A0A0R3LEG9_9BRAD|nr:hypothetical protein [Bradyrhizobium jicamae]KRR06200.1 hypothetical protein CQ12_11480 [Bradyrhizobium jicamae]